MTAVLLRMARMLGRQGDVGPCDYSSGEWVDGMQLGAGECRLSASLGMGGSAHGFESASHPMMSMAPAHARPEMQTA